MLLSYTITIHIKYYLKTQTQKNSEKHRKEQQQKSPPASTPNTPTTGPTTQQTAASNDSASASAITVDYKYNPTSSIYPNSVAEYYIIHSMLYVIFFVFIYSNNCMID